MKLEICRLRKRDYKKAVRFALTGMNFSLYLDSRLLLKLFGKYFWYTELNRATQMIAVYAGKELAGVLLAEVAGERKRYRTVRTVLYVKTMDLLQRILYQNGAQEYERANRQMYRQYARRVRPQGEITFLAVNPRLQGMGAGTMLLKEFERRERGKKIFLYTDEACTYQFYEHRGFCRFGERDIVLNMGKKKIPLKCFLYSKEAAF